VSAVADPSTGYLIMWSTANGASLGGGTSAVAPFWAALWAAYLGTNAPSFAAPFLYSLAGSAAFHDIVVGNNGFNAGPGYDLVTGLGSPNGAAFPPPPNKAVATPAPTAPPTITTVEAAAAHATTTAEAAVVPTAAPTAAPAPATPTGSPCSFQGHSGVCVNVAVTPCTGAVHHGLCAGPANVLCCISGAASAARDAAAVPEAQDTNLNWLGFLALLGAVAVAVVVLVVRRRIRHAANDEMYEPLAPMSRESSVGGRNRLSTRRTSTRATTPPPARSGSPPHTSRTSLRLNLADLDGE